MPIPKVVGEPGKAKGAALERFLGRWCSDAGQLPFEEADVEALGELGDLLLSLSRSPYFDPVAGISRQLTTPLDALTVWDLLADISRWCAQLAAHEARRHGATWEEIGDATSITRSAALQRYEPSAMQRRRQRAQTTRQRAAEALYQPKDFPSSAEEGLAATRDDRDPLDYPPHSRPGDWHTP